MSVQQPLRVMVLGLNYAPEITGIAPYTTAFARHLATEHEVTVVTGHPHYPEWRLHEGYEQPLPPVVDRGVRLIRVPHPVPRDPTSLSRAWMEVVFAHRCALHLLRHRPRVVVVVSPALLALVPAVTLRYVLGHRVGVVVQDLYGAALAETGLGGGLVARTAGWLERQLLKRVHGIVVIHEVFKRRLIESGIAEDRMEVIPNWAHVTMPDYHDRAAGRRSLGWRNDEFIALHAGNMGAKQGLEGLVDVARLAEERGSPVRIVLMGDGSRRHALEEYGAGAARLTFLDPLPKGEFESALAAADCLLLHEKPGVVEMSVPSKLTTYFTAGRPVVAATDPRSAAASLMSASGAGLTVPAGDAQAALAVIESLCEEPELARELGERGRRYAAAHLGEAASLNRKSAWVRRLVQP
jgi:glycosyltransferase involved in cell wall biosynthesis